MSGFVSDFVFATPTGFRFGFTAPDMFFAGITVTGVNLTYAGDGMNMVPVSGTITSIEYGFVDTNGRFDPVLKVVKVFDPFENDVAQLNMDDPDWFKLNEYYGFDNILTAARTNLSAEDDFLNATDAAETINGGDGNDSIFGNNGNDVIRGGNGDDWLGGGGGDDRIGGKAGDDVIGGGDGNDRIYGDDGNDQLSGGDGDDLIIGGVGNDTLFDDDTPFGTNTPVYGDDTLNGGDGADFLISYGGNDVLNGGAGNDGIVMENGNSILRGGAGDDFIGAISGTGTLVGNSGSDTFVFFDQISPNDPAHSDTGNFTVNDFTASEDRILISGRFVTVEEQFDLFLLETEQVGNDVIWTNEDDTVTVRFRNVDLDDLTVDNFAVDEPAMF
ncbi:calcium-binding protein [Pseudaestuariivita rosea]|uniref:calcium-binding protein n=1 Tax=Pseudaestuariivita rosea TaxID=2763263 RepID=UPI002350DC5A|nr:calcium-binding protein [Pseudaestuariivita rosea]